MPQELKMSDLDYAKGLLASKGPEEMYDYLAAKGYKYATLANGVVKGDSVAGEVAINFMKLTASDLNRAMSDSDVNRVRQQMADAYINVLVDKVDKGTGTLTSDINHREAWDFHSKIFKENGLPADAWTLNSVLLVMSQRSREGYWQAALDAAGSLPAELSLAARTDVLMSTASSAGTEQNRKLAKSWINRIDSPSGTLTFLSSVASQLGSAATGLFGPPVETTAGASPINHINIQITPDPKPQQKIPTENQAREDVANGFTQNSPTHRVFFNDQTLNKTDFTSVQLGSLATGGIRPGEVQLDPNVRPSDYLSHFYHHRPSGKAPDFSLRNAVTLNGLAALTTVNTYVDPLLLDLTGDGVQMTPISDGVLFDTDHSGTLKRSGWADRATGMLVIDDGSGQIKDVSQMFSEYFRGTSGVNGQAGQALYKEGFAALASVDSNADQVIDQRDEIWSQLRVWVDASHDGKSDAGELKTLAELGITQINVTATPVSGDIRQGNSVVARGSFVINGATREALAVNFLGDPVSSTLTVEGNGSKVVSTTGTTTTTAYASSSTADETLDAGQLGVTNLYAGSGNDTLTAASTGSWLVGGAGSNIYNGGVGDDVFVISSSDSSQNIHGNGGRDTAIIVGDEGGALNMAQAALTIAQGGRGHDYLISGGQSGVFIKGGSGGATLVGGGGNDVLVGGAGRNTIIGGSGKALIYAGPKGDAIMASAGGSIIHAGSGVDRIYGGAGHDVIEAGHGNAIIDGGGGINLVTLHGKYGDYAISSSGNGYTVTDKVTGRDGTLTLSNIQKLNFADISAVDLQQPNAMPVADALQVNQAGNAFDRTQPHLISAAGVVANDQRLNSKGNLRIASVGDAIGGSASLTEQGDVLFTPDPRFTGILSFKYGLVDEAGNPATSVVDLKTGELAPMRATVTLLTPEVPTDPLAAHEWYLSDIDVLPVWKDYTGKGVRIGQFEPGGEFSTGPEIFDIQHPDLAPNVDQAWLQTQRTNQPQPVLVSNHATMVAGVMVAAKNSLGGVGIAHEATLGGHYLANSGEDLAGMGKMLGYDIANHSWGFTKDFALSNLQGGQINTASALISNARYAASNGRGGLGTLIVTSGGNKRATGGSSQGSLTNNNRFSIQVGALNAQADLSTLEVGSAPFSNPGTSLLVSAPGSNVWSTSYKLETERGSTFGNDYSAMQGTSFAAPIVSGVIALMLQANPNLGYRDVQQILAVSARKVEDSSTQWSDNGASNWNGGGMHANHDYGFGKVDARAAVRLAESWMTQSTGTNEKSLTASSGPLGQVVAAGKLIAPKLAIQSGLNIEHVEVDFDAQVGRLGDLVVKLVSPNGTQSVLLDRVGKIPLAAAGANEADVGSTQSGEFKYTFMSTHDWGERSAGDWTLQVTNTANGLPVTLNSWSLRIYGAEATSDDSYFYTDEFVDAAKRQNARAVLDDGLNGTPGGRNTFNAAAVSADVSIDLSTGTVSIGGVALTVKNPGAIQNLLSGDGNDRLVAGPSGSLLHGGRGKNTLIGGAGNDFFVVHRRGGGIDTVVNFDPVRGEVINLVGFKGKQFGDLRFNQQETDVIVELGEGQTLLLKNQLAADVKASQFKFQDTFVAPVFPNEISAGEKATTTPDMSRDAPGIVTLKGGAGGVSYSTDANGQLIASLTGKVYSHDNEASNVFVVAKQEGVSNYNNAMRGFRQGVDKIDLSQTGITDFSALTISKQNRATINGISLVHGVEVSAGISGAGSKVKLLYLDALEVSQLNAADFIFASHGPQAEVSPDSVLVPITESLANGLSPTSAHEQSQSSERVTRLVPLLEMDLRPSTIERGSEIKLRLSPVIDRVPSRLDDYFSKRDGRSFKPVVFETVDRKIPTELSSIDRDRASMSSIADRIRSVDRLLDDLKVPTMPVVRDHSRTAFIQQYDAEHLVQAMATFAPTNSAALSFMPMEPKSVHPVLAANVG
jgi:subtilisin-like proprotein convertase family protein/Ca2+-binding RTX toxin-like protein